MAESTLLTELLKTDRANTSFTDEQVRNAWENLLKILHNERDASELLHYFIRQDDVVKSSIMDIIQGKADLQDGRNDSDDAFEELLNNLKGTNLSNFWNESVNTALKHFLKYIEVTNDNEAIPGTNGQISYNDIIKANAGYRFSFVNNNADDTNWVKPWMNIDKAKYQDVRAGDEIVKGVLNNKNELQFTHTQSQVDGNDTKFANWIRLLMPKYGRHVEIEDLDRNFWVIGQTVSGISAYLFDDDSPIKTAFKNILREITELWENILYLWAALTMLSKKVYTDVHVEVIYLPNDEYQPYLKYDNYMYDSTPDTGVTWMDVCNRLEPYKQMYTESNLALIIIRRRKSYYHNYYSQERISGIAFYDRNNPNTSYNGFRPLGFGSSGSEDLCDINISDWSDFLYGVNEISYNEVKYYSPFSNVSSYKDEEETPYIGAIRTIIPYQEGMITYNKDTSTFILNKDKFEIDLYDAIGCSVKKENGDLLQSSKIGSFTYNTNISISKTNNEVTYKSLTKNNTISVLPTSNGAGSYDKGYYLGELVSGTLVSSEQSYGLKEKSINITPIGTPGHLDSEDDTNWIDTVTYYSDIVKYKSAIKRDNLSILSALKTANIIGTADDMTLVVGTRSFNLYKNAPLTDNEEKKDNAAHATSRDGIGGYYSLTSIGGSTLKTRASLGTNYYKAGAEVESYKDKYRFDFSDFNDYLLPMSLYDSVTGSSITQSMTQNAYGANENNNFNYENISFTGSHGGRIDYGAYLYVPWLTVPIEYTDYENFKIFPHGRTYYTNEQGTESSSDGYTSGYKAVDGKNTNEVIHTLDHAELLVLHNGTVKNFYGREGWNDITTIKFRKVGDSVYKKDNWLIAYIKTFGGYGLYLNNKTLPSAIKTRINGGSAIEIEDSFGYKNRDGEGAISKHTGTFKPYVLKVCIHIFTPNKADYGWHTRSFWTYDSSQTGNDKIFNEGFVWNSSGDIQNSSTWTSYNYDNLLSNIEKVGDTTGLVNGVRYEVVSWNSSNPTNNKKTEGDAEVLYNFYKYPHAGT